MVGITIEFLGNLGKGVAFYNGIKPGFGFGAGGGQLIVHRGNAKGVAQGDGDFFSISGCGGIAFDRYFIAVNGNIQTFGIQAMFFQFFLQVFGGSGTGFAATKNLLAYVFNEVYNNS